MMNDSKKINLGEAYYDHFEKFLGEPIDNIVFENSGLDRKIQVLVFKDVFKNCITFATMGLSHYSNDIGACGELVCVVDDGEAYVPQLLVNTIKTIVLKKMSFGWGMGITGNDKISSEFSLKTGKNAFYITTPLPFPEDFSYLTGFDGFPFQPRIYLGIFISDKEYKMFCDIGAEKFEEYLEREKIDPFDVMRR